MVKNLRVISGVAGGLRLKTLEGLKTRPTADRIKESLFNIINSQISGADILDLFAGSGALGIESLSRGARFAAFIDNNKESIAIIKENLAYTKLIEHAEVYFAEFGSVLKKLQTEKKRFDIIFLDPPYGKGFEFKAMDEIMRLDILKEDGIVVLENEQKDTLPIEISGMIQTDIRRYGRTAVSFYRIREGNV
jgi:16S rRNA (guanine(966)-N(2))-methyltransferase RsmD